MSRIRVIGGSIRQRRFERANERFQPHNSRKNRAIADLRINHKCRPLCDDCNLWNSAVLARPDLTFDFGRFRLLD